MYNQPYSKSPSRTKTPKSDGNNIFRIPSPLSPTFVTTQSLTRIPVQRKKDRVLSSPSLTVKQGSQQLSSHFLSPNHLASDGKIKYLPNSSSSSYHGYSTSQLVANVVAPMEDHESYVNKTHDIHKTTHETHKVNRAQLYLPGDHVIFAESASVPGIPIVYRVEEERKSNPDKLNLDRRKLSVCPILEGEEHLRLLNYQHNYIKKIEHLSMLTKLIFLDLYDNQIEEMSGLSSLKLLRVLMLGKNRISKISNLHELIMLDVLDLHGNNITKIENVDHLRHLRVLNLAGNDLTTVDNLMGLASLSELNLRRNTIHTVHDIDELPCLQRLFLSFNDIRSFNDIICLSKSLSLIELSLDGNPFSKCSDYKQLIIQNVTNLRQIDMKRLTDEEKRYACITAKREEEKRKEHERLSTMKEKRRIAISNAQRQWNQQLKNRVDESHLPSLNMGSYEKLEKKSPIKTSPRECFAIDQCTLKVVDRVKSLSASHLAELDNDSLNLYGCGSLEALDKDWGEKTLSSIIVINFKYINFHDIIPHLHKLCRNFPSLNSLNFDMTNITSLNELNTFSLFARLDNLQITPAGNSVTKLSLWKPYAIFRLSHLQLKTLNGKEITHSDILHANNIFESISQNMTSKLPNYRILMLQSNYKSLSAEHLSTIPLWLDQGTTDAQKTDTDERKQFSSSYVSEILHNGILGDRKIKLLDECWWNFLLDIVSTCLNEMTDLDKYCDTSLERIRKSLKTTN